jgi:hypothetical protein
MVDKPLSVETVAKTAMYAVLKEDVKGVLEIDDIERLANAK